MPDHDHYDDVFQHDIDQLTAELDHEHDDIHELDDIHTGVELYRAALDEYRAVLAEYRAALDEYNGAAAG